MTNDEYALEMRRLDIQERELSIRERELDLKSRALDFEIQQHIDQMAEMKRAGEMLHQMTNHMGHDHDADDDQPVISMPSRGRA